ncbi:MAG: hypothetical protein EB060_03855 [Proteobacteria bacterium]|nr:hypothetical protein [Pseudomonadota bacterium]
MPETLVKLEKALRDKMKSIEERGGVTLSASRTLTLDLAEEEGKTVFAMIKGYYAATGRPDLEEQVRLRSSGAKTDIVMPVNVVDTYEHMADMVSHTRQLLKMSDDPLERLTADTPKKVSLEYPERKPQVVRVANETEANIVQVLTTTLAMHHQIPIEDGALYTKQYPQSDAVAVHLKDEVVDQIRHADRDRAKDGEIDLMNSDRHYLPFKEPVLFTIEQVLDTMLEMGIEKSRRFSFPVANHVQGKIIADIFQFCIPVKKGYALDMNDSAGLEGGDLPDGAVAFEDPPEQEPERREPPDSTWNRVSAHQELEFAQKQNVRNIRARLCRIRDMLFNNPEMVVKHDDQVTLPIRGMDIRTKANRVLTELVKAHIVPLELYDDLDDKMPKHEKKTLIVPADAYERIRERESRETLRDVLQQYQRSRDREAGKGSPERN